MSDRIQGKHSERHPFFVDGCFGCKVSTVMLSAHATPTRSAEVVSIDRMQRRWDKDMPAYKRLRQDGQQPNRIDGSAELEAMATSSTEIERGRKMKGGGKRFAEVDAAIKAGQLEEVI